MDKPVTKVLCPHTWGGRDLVTAHFKRSGGTSIFVNSVDSDEMPHNAAFRQGHHCLPR